MGLLDVGHFHDAIPQLVLPIQAPGDFLAEELVDGFAGLRGMFYRARPSRESLMAECLSGPEAGHGLGLVPLQF